MATEENKEAEVEAEEKKSAVKNIVHIMEDENSYINSAKERMNDVIDTFLTNAENSVALNDFSLIFKSTSEISLVISCVSPVLEHSGLILLRSCRKSSSNSSLLRSKSPSDENLSDYFSSSIFYLDINGLWF